MSMSTTTSFFTRLPGASICALATAALLLAAGPTAADTPREQALQAIESADPQQRRAAVVELATSAAPEDAPVLLEALHDDDPGVRTLAEQAVWRVWLRSGDPDVDALMRSGMHYMEEGRLGAAVDAFTRIIEKRPDFAEGWNKRATVYFLIGDFDQSLKDCDETLKRNPNHFGALSGCGAIYARRDELERAVEYFERALEINPNLEGVEHGLGLLQRRLGSARKQSI
jgi:tetratricopeptide (TPR) repeat protein